jgi:hypothetical protein
MFNMHGVDPFPDLTLVRILDKTVPVSKGRRLKRYSVISITLRYVNALSHNS